MWKEMKEFLAKDWTCSDKVILGLICLLAGVILGFLWSPIKRGIAIGSNNTTCGCDGYDDEDYM